MWKITPDSELLELTPSEPQEPSPAQAGIVWVASEHLSFTRCKIPPKQRTMTDKMVAFSLEDQVLEPIEKLHFALGPAQDNNLPIAIASQDNMRQWTDMCQKKGLSPQTLRADIYAVPYEEGRMTIWHEGDRCLLRNGQHSGFAGTLDWILGVAGLSDKASNSHNTQLDIYSNGVDQLPEAWRPSARPLLAPLDEMMLRSEEASTINLFQGSHALENPMAEWLIPWKAAALFAALAVGLHIATMLFEVQALDARASVIQQDTLKLFKTIDHEGREGNIRQQVTQYFQRLQERRAKSRQSAWSIFTIIDPAISRCKVCRIETLKLDGKTLKLKIRAEGDFEPLKDELSDIPSLRSDFKLLKEAKGYSILRFTLSLRDE